MTQEDIQALNQCPVGESVTVKTAYKKVPYDDQAGCPRCCFYHVDCDDFCCVDGYFVEVSNDQ